MKKNSLHTKIFSFGYWFSSRSLGLVLHPYATMQAIVREHFLRPLVFLPLLIWFMSWGMGFLIFHVASLLPDSLVTPLLFIKPILAFFWWWMSLLMLWWQIVLGYLYVRFRLVFS